MSPKKLSDIRRKLRIPNYGKEINNIYKGPGSKWTVGTSFWYFLHPDRF